ncbi:DNA polymerase III subunit beta [Hippea sp. KM1]|uniref:DNA polymerase III subunit beta n=1 Tax=Hippea sp. KM1 TaxID=944481 RepID=UPI00046D037C|nr:DNA polymerase III subunit beta [Hippea sp. KM1]
MSVNIQTKALRDLIGELMLSTAKEKDSILSNILIEIDENGIKGTALNNITSIEKTIETKTDSSLSFTTDPQKLANILREIKEETIELDPEGKTITIKSSGFKTKIKVQDPQMFPKVKHPENTQKICTIKAEKLKKLIKETIYCPDKNDIAREYTGVFVEVEEQQTKATATDHYRLINIKTENQNQTQTSLIIENAGATLISRLSLEGDVELYRGENELLIKQDNLIIVSKLISGNFPDYNQILLDRETSNSIEIDKEKLKDGVKRSSILSENKDITVKIDINEKTMSLVGQNSEGETAEDVIEINPLEAQKDLIIKLNSKFILDFLNQIEADSVVLLYRSAEEPIMFESSEDQYSYKYIMTPIIE